MAKIFNDLKQGDDLFRISIGYASSGARKGNCPKAYSILHREFSLEEYPIMSGVSRCPIEKTTRPSYNPLNKYSLSDPSKLMLYYNAGPHIMHQQVNPSNTAEVIRTLSSSYHIYATTKEECIDKAIEIATAMIDVNRNLLIERNKELNKIISKLNSEL